MRSSVRAVLMSGGTAFDPVSLFAKYSASGFYYDLTAAAGLFQDDGATTPVTADGQSIGYATDQSGSYNGTQGTAAAKPTWKTGATNYASFDGGDYLDTGCPCGNEVTIAALMQEDNAAGFMMGSATSGYATRCYLGLQGDGYAQIGWRTGVTEYSGGGDLEGAPHVLLGRGNANTRQIWLDGALGNSEAASGSAPTSVDIFVGGIDLAGVFASAGIGRGYRFFAINAYISDADAVLLSRALGQGVVTI